MATMLQSGTSTRPFKLVKVEGCSLSLQCPACGTDSEEPFGREVVSPLACRACGFILTDHEGIWRALAPGRELKYARFMEEYQTVRQREGRSSTGGHYYLAL